MPKSHIQQGKSKCRFVGLLGIASIYYSLPKYIKGDTRKAWEDRIEWEMAEMFDKWNRDIK